MSKFNIVVADPPWGAFSDKLTMSNIKRGAKSNYDVMSTDDIANLDVQSICAKDALLALWVPSSLLSDGLKVMERWGFALKQTWIWVKTKKEPLKKFVHPKHKDFHLIDSEYDISKFDLKDTLAFGMGRLGRNCHELVLIGTKGKIYKHLKNKSQRTVFFGPSEKHSKKPDGLQDMLDIMFPSNKLIKIEFFSRRQRSGWWCIGNEAIMTKNEDIRMSLSKLKTMTTYDMFPINKAISCYDDGKKEILFKMWGNLSC